MNIYKIWTFSLSLIGMGKVEVGEGLDKRGVTKLRVAVLHMKWLGSLVAVASRTFWIRTSTSGEDLLKFKIRVTVEPMTMETCLNIHPFCFLSQILNLPVIKHGYVSPYFKNKEKSPQKTINFLHWIVLLPSLAKFISKAIILIYCINFSCHSLLIPLKRYIFYTTTMKVALKKAHRV